MLAQVDLEGPISEAWERVVVFVPKLLGFLAILIIGYFVAKLLERVVDRLLERVGFDRWVERGALREALARSRFDASDIMATIVFWTALLFVLQLAFGVFGSNPISELIAGVIAFLPKLFVAVLILVIAAALARVLTELLEAVLGTVSGGGWIARAAGIAVLVLGIFMALNQLEIAPEIVNGLFYAILAIVVGSAIVAIGGGGIQTMRTYWERAAARTEVKARELKQQARPEAARERVEQATQRGSAETPAPGTGSRWAG